MLLSVITLFPEMFSALTESGVTGKAYKENLFSLFSVNPRDFAEDKHKTVDDKPYGGGPGMVMAVKPLRQAIKAACIQLQTEAQANRQSSGEAKKPKVIYLSPQGKPLNQELVEELAKEQVLVLVCGRYEGIDERVIERDIDMEVSLGDYVISGGELAAMVLADALIRLQPGVLGDENSALQDSFSVEGLLDYPHYTRPEEIDGQSVPSILLSGDHAKIADWRRRQSLERTQHKRPDLLSSDLEKK